MLFNIILMIILLAIGGLIEHIAIHVLNVKCFLRGLAVPIRLFLTFCKTHQTKYLLLFICDAIDIIAFFIVAYKTLTTL